MTRRAFSYLPTLSRRATFGAIQRENHKDIDVRLNIFVLRNDISRPDIRDIEHASRWLDINMRGEHNSMGTFVIAWRCGQQIASAAMQSNQIRVAARAEEPRGM
jgi:hypothetical protein